MPTDPTDLPHAARRDAQRATDLFTMGASVGVVGLAGAALGAVCPLCVVATPTLLTLAAVHKLRGAWYASRVPRTTPERPTP